MTYADFLAIQENLKLAVRKIGALLNAYPRAANGLTLDANKDANWSALKQAQARAFTRLRAFNGANVKSFEREIRADRDARRAAKLAAFDA